MANVRFLDQHYDPALDVRLDVTPEEVEQGELRRLNFVVAALRHARMLKRRLGGDASREEMARDKKFIRRLEHAMSQSMTAWGGNPDEAAHDEASKVGATREWESWAIDHSLWLDTRVRYMATYAKKKGHPKWGAQAVVRLRNEQEWVRYALRD